MKATLLLALALARTVAPRQQVILIAGASPVGALVADRLLWRRHGVAGVVVADDGANVTRFDALAQLLDASRARSQSAVAAVQVAVLETLTPWAESDQEPAEEPPSPLSASPSGCRQRESIVVSGNV